MTADSSVTLLLDRLREGDERAFSDLVARLYDELRAVARSQRRKLSAAETINTTAVLHEAYARLGRGEAPSLNDRQHFFSVAARTMRGVIIDYARTQSRAKRGGRGRPVSLDGLGPVGASDTLDINEVLAVDAALDRLTALDTEAARVVELRYFAGLTIREVADALGLSERTVKRRWTLAQAWLYRHLSEGASEPP